MGRAAAPTSGPACKARQGVHLPGARRADGRRSRRRWRRCRADGATMGEIMMRGNIVMKGYLKNPTATEEAFAGGWFHTGDLAVMHPDGYVEIKDRSKDIIISGGENISLDRGRGRALPPPGRAGGRRRRPARPEMGRDPLRLRHAEGRRHRRPPPRSSRFCRQHLAHFKAPRTSSSARCRRPRPARSRNSCCASGRRRRGKRVSGSRTEPPGSCRMDRRFSWASDTMLRLVPIHKL